MDKMTFVTLLGVAVAAIVGINYFIRSPFNDEQYFTKEDFFYSEEFSDLINEDNKKNAKMAHIVELWAPWGEIFQVHFSSEEWSMVIELAEISGDRLEDTVAGIVFERYENGTL